MKNKMFQNGSFAIAVMMSLSLALQPLAARAEAPNKPPVIQHDPVTYSIAGQSLTLKAKVTDASPGVQSVALYYALFRDAAPFRVTMKPSGLDFYVGTIDANMIKDVKTIAYYIEAQDKDGVTAETSWYSVEFRKAEETAPAVAQPGGTPASTPKAAEGEGSNWKTYALIGAGVVALGVGGYALANSGGGGDSSSGGGGGGTVATNVAGTYNGAVTTCLTVSGKQPTCEEHACTIVIDSKGAVLSNSLLTDEQLTGNVSGNEFILSGQVSNQGSVSNGVINYIGRIQNGRINGSINGSASTADGPGSYSGSFSATK